jgi:hypothetical protein
MNNPPEILSGIEVQALQNVQPRFHLFPYIPEDSITFLFGKYGTWKTPLSLQMAKAIATGKQLWGLDVVQATPILYVEADSPRNAILERMQLIHLPGDLDICFCYPTANIVHPASTQWDLEAIDALKRAHSAKNYKVVFIDALRGCHDLDDKLSETPHRVYAAAKALFPGSSIVFIHHERKIKQDDTDDMRDEGFSGSMAWVNHATVAVRVVKVGNNLLHIRHTKSQASDLQPPIQLLVQDDGCNFTTQQAATIHQVAPILQLTRQQSLSKHQTDKMIASQLGISIRTATRRRLEIEEMEKSGVVVS